MFIVARMLRKLVSGALVISSERNRLQGWLVINRLKPGCCKLLVSLQEVKPRRTLSYRETSRTDVETFYVNVKPFGDVALVWTAPGRPC